MFKPKLKLARVDGFGPPLISSKPTFLPLEDTRIKLIYVFLLSNKMYSFFFYNSFAYTFYQNQILYIFYNIVLYNCQILYKIKNGWDGWIFTNISTYHTTIIFIITIDQNTLLYPLSVLFGFYIKLLIYKLSNIIYILSLSLNYIPIKMVLGERVERPTPSV